MNTPIDDGSEAIALAIREIRKTVDREWLSLLLYEISQKLYELRYKQLRSERARLYREL